MKKLLYILFCITLSTNSIAKDIVHGIDVDQIYETSDWNSKEDIKEIINGYAQLLQYKDNLQACELRTSTDIECYDNIVINILENFYINPKLDWREQAPNNYVEEYKEFKTALINSYYTLACNNKFGWPSGKICVLEQNEQIKTTIKAYIEALLDISEKHLKTHEMLKNFKK